MMEDLNKDCDLISKQVRIVKCSALVFMFEVVLYLDILPQLRCKLESLEDFDCAFYKVFRLADVHGWTCVYCIYLQYFNTSI